MDIVSLIKHPETLDKDTLYELRSMVALYPYFQTARLLMLQNLYLLHDPSFDEELRRAAIFITDRKVIFSLIEAAHYQIPKHKSQSAKVSADGDRTTTLIDNFLESIPTEEEDESKAKVKRKPTPADATVDYVAYLMECENEQQENDNSDDKPTLKGQDLIDNFLEQEGKIILPELPELQQEEKAEENDENEADEGFFTETLARIYIKQGNYLKALQIIKRLNLQHPKKNAYFADQIRFLEKLIINSNKK